VDLVAMFGEYIVRVEVKTSVVNAGRA